MYSWRGIRGNCIFRIKSWSTHPVSNMKSPAVAIVKIIKHLIGILAIVSLPKDLLCCSSIGFPNPAVVHTGVSGLVLTQTSGDTKQSFSSVQWKLYKLDHQRSINKKRSHTSKKVWYNKYLIYYDNVNFGKWAVQVYYVHCTNAVLHTYFSWPLSEAYSVLVLSASFVLPAVESVMTFFGHVRAHTHTHIHIFLFPCCNHNRFNRLAVSLYPQGRKQTHTCLQACSMPALSLPLRLSSSSF